MNESTQVTKSEAQALPDNATVTLVPPVDIVEDEAGITVTADLPGVSKERLNIRLDSDNLLIEGEAAVVAPQGIELRYTEIRAPHYRRSFALSRELDSSNIDAKLKDGVLTLRIPKTAAARPRRIEVKMA